MPLSSPVRSAHYQKSWATRNAAGATERLLELMEVQSPIQNPARPLALPQRTVKQAGGASLSIRDIRFHYPSRPDTASIAGVTLDIPAGQTIAVVGSSGAGKLPYFNCCCAFMIRKAEKFNSTV
jgi:ATP-binding cassette subfamily B protein